LSSILFNLYSKYLTNEAPEEFGDFKIGGQVIRTVKYADDLVLLAQEEPVLQGMLERLIEFGSCDGMEMNVERTKVLKISRQPSPIQTMIDQKQKDNVEYFNYLGSMITNEARCARKIISRIAKATTAFNKKEILFASEMESNLKKKLVKCYIWSITSYGAEN